VVFQGTLYVGSCWTGAAGTAAIIVSRKALATWATARTGPGTATLNAWTSLAVYNGLMFAGWTSGDGSSAAVIQSTVDGVTWITDVTLASTDVVLQMVTFNDELYAVCGKTTAAYNTTTSIIKRTTGGVWSVVDDPADNFAGCLGVVYL
jgi:hypothetical protein